MASFKAIAQLAPIRVAYVQTQAAGTAVDNYIFLNPAGSGEYFEVVEVAFRYGAAGGAGAKADVMISADGSALGLDRSALDGTACDLTQTADTGYKANVTAGTLINPGDGVGIQFSGTLTGLVGLVVLVTLKPVAVKKTH